MMDNNSIQLIDFQVHGDKRGQMIVAEGLKDIPFKIARIFYMYGSDQKTVRGQHANRRSEFVLINVCGTSRVKVTNGRIERSFDLDRPNVGIYLPKMVWKEMYAFSEDSILLCLASEPYDAAEYIRDYNEYLREMQKHE